MPRSLLALAVSLAARRTIGSTLCSDHHTSCAHWANGGDCWGENATTVIKTCPASCGICRPGCEDSHPECRHWAQDGECYSNSGPVRLLLPRVHFVTLTPDLSPACDRWAMSGRLVSPSSHSLDPKKLRELFKP
ncbi:hypothetical protein EMIHUDRAFT_245354 [Emiliania huxleyi CCMP1516]|uniref:ShKT domain-containing protein n=2 Tax=Emiliania huxleyi TaxID=2903 RepID=A0A0D3I206_EMIH1|nr:hypothetical protein EMIHUDRAFT_198921 [Emiliania huxleyi CCMP1516]XP_005768532.1 hypothetical protein EMIHUDRAFT_245354 [Emiliania huxleyi CCMP1516]EOD05291.1 hypothetical protein EMIHUDRAFT_198921 [Emiliania huxleyi CCMP1516]EOD16103.1 hypothetical protein EMIHUDRAFT_245354 [Emiliania huxleyi CCMP1516]|eukprot:XP_005757720.1 hypothetical protein EMIHUDRAFT_198921 [Emiliania huxleyi CCMP1516]